MVINDKKEIVLVNRFLLFIICFFPIIFKTIENLFNQNLPLELEIEKQKN